MLTDDDYDRHSTEIEELRRLRNRRLDRMYSSCDDGMCGADDCNTCHPYYEEEIE